jgi:hypothetical protein
MNPFQITSSAEGVTVFVRDHAWEVPASEYDPRVTWLSLAVFGICGGERSGKGAPVFSFVCADPGHWIQASTNDLRADFSLAYVEDTAFDAVCEEKHWRAGVDPNSSSEMLVMSNLTYMATNIAPDRAAKLVEIVRAVKREWDGKGPSVRTHAYF